MKRRTFTLGMCGCAAGALSGCVTDGELQRPDVSGPMAKGYRPGLTSDEGSLWMDADRTEQELKQSTKRVRDKGINALISDMVCRMGGDYCPDLRPYVVRQPTFNASCSPNGMIQVYTGLLLRCSSESQVAAVIGHEIGHYLLRHSVLRARNNREWRQWSQVSAAMGMAGSLAELHNMISRYARMSYSRDHERQSDEIGFHLMVKAGYDPRACAGVWKGLVEEDKAGDVEEDFNIFASTHPATSERIETLSDLAKTAAEKSDYPDRLADSVAPIRGMLLADELAQGRFKRSEKLFDRLITAGRAPGEVLYYKGELYRRRGQDSDLDLALGFYHEACEAAGAPAEAFRSVGLMRWRRGEKDMAREYFRRYLAKNPEAGDREMIRNYLAGA